MTTIRVSVSQGGLDRFRRELEALHQAVARADGSYVLYVDSAPSTPEPSMFIRKGAFAAALSPAMRAGPPRAFSPHFAGGGFLPARLDAAYAAYQRAQAKADVENAGARSLIRNRRDYLAVYNDTFGFYPKGKMGSILNDLVTKELI